MARLRPQPDVAASVRKLPTVNRTAAAAPVQQDDGSGPQVTSDTKGDVSLALASGSLLPLARRAVITPLAPQRYSVRLTVSAETYEKLRRAQALLRHQIPDGDPAKIVDRALTALLEDLTKKKLAATDRPRESRRSLSHSRHIPAEVQRAGLSRVPSCCATCGGWESHDREHPAPVPCA